LVAALASIGSGNTPTAVRAQEENVALTIYNQDLALVRDHRALTLKSGLNNVRITDVAAQIDPTSVHFQSLTDPEGTSVLEQNYEYDLVNTRKLMQRYLDQRIAMVTADGTVYSGTLLSGDGNIILASPNGSVTVVNQSRVQEFKFPKLPEGLITRPTLLWQLSATKAGKHDVEINYLTGGMSWQANYVALVSEDDKQMDLNGWVTINNRSGATFKDADLKLIAGNVRKVKQALTEKTRVAMEAAVPTATPQFTERGFFEYHLYTLQRPTTLKNDSTKQIEFTTATGVPVEKIYIYDGSQFRYVPGRGPITTADLGFSGNKRVNVLLEFKNEKKAGLGIPLPKGVVRVYKEDADGSSQFIGEDRIDHTPKDETIRLHVGDAFDIVGERKQTDFRKLSDRLLEESFEITLRNHKETAVTVRVVEHLYRWSDWEIVKESQKHTKSDSNTIVYKVRVPANGEAKVSYTVRYRF
jgi:hypothetical protein